MNDPFPEELLSAYLDGELPREERARVEAWLAASADHRRLFDDLQAIRRELQALPQQSLDAGFCDRVLIAIREQSGDPSASSPAASGTPATDVPEPSQTIPIKPASLQSRHLGMPAWRWFAAGVAATLAAVLVGINAAPDMMAEIGRLAQVRPQEQKADEELAPKQTHQPMSVPSATTPALRETAGGFLVTEAPQGDSDVALDPGLESRSMPRSAAKDVQEESIHKARIRKEAVPADRVEPHRDAPPGAPNSASSASPSLAGAQLRQLDKKNLDADSRENLPKQDSASPPLATTFAERSSSAEYDEVVELPVTSQQADRALAYAFELERQSAPDI